MSRRIYNEMYDEEMEMMEMQRRGGGGSRGGQGGRSGRSGGQGGNRYPRNERSGRGAYNAYGYSPYSDYEEDEWEDEDEMDMYGAYNEMEMKRGVPGSGRGRRRRRDSRGRFTSMMDEEMGYYPNGPYMNQGKKHKIGFASPSMGGSMGQEFDEEELMMILEEIPDEIDEREGKMWMKKLQNSDGTIGEHWSKEQTSKIFNEHKVREKSKGKVDEEQFYYVMNMLYSDYCKSLKENNANSIQMYVALAIAFLADEDAVDNKLARYYHCIVDA